MGKKKEKEGEISESVHRIWLAGLGALSAAEDEGTKLFNTLVARGRKYERTMKKPVDKAADEVKRTVEDVRGRAGRTVKKIERAFDDQIDAALHRIGVPTRKEIAALSRKVEKLTRTIEGKPKRAAKKGKTVKKKAAKKKAGGKKTAKKKTGAKTTG
jgi:poly(hydroxyalkanoate) granule-associated protein